MYITPLGHLTLHTFANNITWHGIKDFEVYDFSLTLRVSLSFKVDSCYLLNNLWSVELGFLCARFIENFLHRGYYKTSIFKVPSKASSVYYLLNDSDSNENALN